MSMPRPFDQRRQTEAGQHQRCREVDGDLTGQLFGIGVREQGREAETGVVDQDVEPAESRGRLGDQAPGRRRVGQVGGDRQDLEIRLLRAGVRRTSDRDDRHDGRSKPGRRAFRRRTSSRASGFPDAGRGSGDQDDRACRGFRRTSSMASEFHRHSEALPISSSVEPGIGATPGESASPSRR